MVVYYTINPVLIDTVLRLVILFYYFYGDECIVERQEIYGFLYYIQPSFSKIKFLLPVKMVKTFMIHLLAYVY